jgi:predicted DNA-binding transcriptional regulator AlpA
MVTTIYPQLLTMEETAEMLRKTPKQIHWMIYAGTAPKSALIGGKRMFRRSDIEAYLDNAFGEVAA